MVSVLGGEGASQVSGRRKGPYKSGDGVGRSTLTAIKFASRTGTPLRVCGEDRWQMRERFQGAEINGVVTDGEERGHAYTRSIVSRKKCKDRCSRGRRKIKCENSSTAAEPN